MYIAKLTKIKKKKKNHKGVTYEANFLILEISFLV